MSTTTYIAVIEIEGSDADAAQLADDIFSAILNDFAVDGGDDRAVVTDHAIDRASDVLVRFHDDAGRDRGENRMSSAAAPSGDTATIVVRVEEA